MSKDLAHSANLPMARRTWVYLRVRHCLDVESELSREAKYIETSQDIGLSPGIPRFLDSECSECKLLVDQSVGIARHLASPCHKFLKSLSDEERVRFLTSSPGLGTIFRACHIYQAPKETVKVDCPKCGLAFGKQDLWEHQVENLPLGNIPRFCLK